MDTKKNRELFFKKLQSIGIDTEKLEKEYGTLIENATFTNTSEKNLAYNGSLLNVILYKLTPYAIRLNELLPEEKRAEKNSLIKVCLLHHIAKSVRFIINDNEWEVKNRKMLYKYNPENPSIKGGMHSYMICTQCGITFTEDETEAMIINDRDPSDDQARWFSSKLATIVRMANELTYIENND